MLKVYLNNCVFNRPFDDQSQIRIKLETEAKFCEPFDYTKWQRSLWADRSIEEISQMAMHKRLMTFKLSRTETLRRN